MNNLIISPSPHLQTRLTTTSIMRDVLIALTPAAVAGVVLFGLKAAIIIAVCVCTAVLSELLFNLACKKKQTVTDLSAAVTGLLLALSLPTTVTVWQCVLGSMFAIIVVKCLFGGLGCNFANPAVTARVFLLIAFTDTVGGGTLTRFANAELVSGATPLELIKSGSAYELPSLIDMLLGNRGGAIGEGCAIALLIGFIYLVARRVIKWHTPVIIIATVFVLSLIITNDPVVALYQVLSGGLLIGAVFMATDYVTTPINKYGKMVFALGCGILTVLIRFFGSYPEGLSYAILIMNVLSPYIEKLCAPKPFGKVGK